MCKRRLFRYLAGVLFALLTISFNSDNFDSEGVADAKVSTETAVQRKRNAIEPRWIVYNPTLCNATEAYDFNTKGEYFNGLTDYSYKNPDYNLLQARYSPNGGGITLATYVNCSCFLSFAYDSTGIKQNLYPASSFMQWPDIVSNGIAFFGLDFSSQLPANCEINDDSRYLNDTNENFRFSDSSVNPRIGKGIAIYRSSATGSFTGWDGYYSLDAFASSDTRIQFNENRYCQVVVLHEIHNYDDGWWIFQNHQYYHVIGIYNFSTSSIH